MLQMFSLFLNKPTGHPALSDETYGMKQKGGNAGAAEYINHIGT
jgi:hypothetical protein